MQPPFALRRAFNGNQAAVAAVVFAEKLDVGHFLIAVHFRADNLAGAQFQLFQVYRAVGGKGTDALLPHAHARQHGFQRVARLYFFVIPIACRRHGLYFRQRQHGFYRMRAGCSAFAPSLRKPGLCLPLRAVLPMRQRLPARKRGGKQRQKQSRGGKAGAFPIPFHGLQAIRVVQNARFYSRPPFL